MAILGYVKEMPMTGVLGLGGGVSGRAFPMGGGDEYWWLMAKGYPQESSAHTGLRWPMNIEADGDGNVYTSWTKQGGGGCIVSKHNKFGKVQWVKQIMVSSDGSGGLESPTTGQSNTRWAGGMARSPYNGNLICSVLDFQPSGTTSYGDIVHVAISSSGSEAWSVRHSAAPVSASGGWNLSIPVYNGTGSGYWQARGNGHGATRSQWVKCHANDAQDRYIDTSMYLKQVGSGGYGYPGTWSSVGTTDNEFMCVFKASDGDHAGSDFGKSAWWRNSSWQIQERLNTQDHAAYTTTSGSDWTMYRANNGYHQGNEYTINSSGEIGSNYYGIDHWWRFLNTYPNTHYGHDTYRVTAVNTYQYIMCAGFTYPSAQKRQVSVLFINSSDSGTCTKARWATDQGLWIDCLDYSQNDSRLYASGYAKNNSQKHTPIFARAEFTNTTKDWDWAKRVTVERNGSTVNARATLIKEVDGKVYCGIKIEEGWQNGILMVWEAVDGPTNGTYGEGTTGSQDIQITIASLGGSDGWVGAGNGNQYFGNGGTGIAHSSYTNAGGNAYATGTITESDNATLTNLTTPQNVVDGNTSANADYKGFTNEVQSIDQESD
jgi:hypothetical protein